MIGRAGKPTTLDNAAMEDRSISTARPSQVQCMMHCTRTERPETSGLYTVSDFRSQTQNRRVYASGSCSSFLHTTTTNELSTSSVRLNCLFSVKNALPDNDGPLRRCLGDTTHPAYPEPAHPELALLILSLPIIVLPMLALLAFALPILALPIFALPALVLPLLVLPLLVHLKAEPALPESAPVKYANTKCAHAERDPLDLAHPDRTQPECTQPSDPTPSASSAHNLSCSPANIPAVRRFSKTCMTPLTGISDGQLKGCTVASSSHELLGPRDRGEFYSSHS